MVRAVFLISLLFSPRLVLSFVRLSSRAARSVLALRNFSLKQGVCRRDWLFCLQCGRWCGGGGVQDKKQKRGKESAFFPSKCFFWGGRISFWIQEVLSKRPLFQKRGLNSHSLLASLFRSWLVQAWSKGKGKRRHKKGRKKKSPRTFFSLLLSLSLLTNRRKTPCRRRASSTTRSPSWGFCTGPEPGRSQRARRRLGAWSPPSRRCCCRRRRRRQREQQQQLASPSPLRRRRRACAPSQRSSESDQHVLSREEDEEEEERPRLLRFWGDGGKKI